MEKTSIYFKDYLVTRIISMGKQVDGYDTIFYETNEDLSTIMGDVSFSNKEVFSVLASSDQLFTARYLGAKNVDCFDRNRLTLYYFYLRRWSIKYMNSLYPDVFDIGWMRKLISMVEPESEMENIALWYYKSLLENDTDFEKLFYDIDRQAIGSTLYKRANDVRTCIGEVNFSEFDLFRKSEVKKTYDILLLSNVLEWARGDKVKLSIAKDNIERLLNDDGIVICSYLIDRNKSSEREVFKDFEVQEYGLDVGYMYKK